MIDTHPEHDVSIPYHVGIIPDGNRRWAKQSGLPSLEGHRRGMDVSRTIALAAFDRGVRVITLYAFSTENWKRTADEVGYLMDLFYKFLINEFAELERNHVRFRFAGSRVGLSEKILRAIDELEARTAGLTAGTLMLCINYGGQQEIVDATAAIIAEGTKPEDVTPELIEAHLYAPDVPPIDLVMRTSGEERLSGFMLWRASYAEFSFVEKQWPDFSTDDLDMILANYADRNRRFGS